MSWAATWTVGTRTARPRGRGVSRRPSRGPEGTCETTHARNHRKHGRSVSEPSVVIETGFLICSLPFDHFPQCVDDFRWAAGGSGHPEHPAVGQVYETVGRAPCGFGLVRCVGAWWLTIPCQRCLDVICRLPGARIAHLSHVHASFSFRGFCKLVRSQRAYESSDGRVFRASAGTPCGSCFWATCQRTRPGGPRSKTEGGLNTRATWSSTSTQCGKAPVGARRQSRHSTVR